MKITNEEELNKALNRIDEIWNLRSSDEGYEERGELVAAISEYEDEHYHIDPPSFIDRILFRLDQSILLYKVRQVWKILTGFL